MFNTWVEVGPQMEQLITDHEALALYWKMQQALRTAGQVYVWDDMRVAATTIRPAAGGGVAATEAIYRDLPVISFASNPSQRAYFITQVPHGYYEGTDIDAHIHWITPSEPAGADVNVKWDIEIQWMNIAGAVLATPDISLTSTIDITGFSNVHIYSDIGEPAGEGKTISSILGGYIERDTTVANDFASAVGLMELDFHIKLDTTGSRQENFK